MILWKNILAIAIFSTLFMTAMIIIERRKK